MVSKVNAAMWSEVTVVSQQLLWLPLLQRCVPGQKSQFYVFQQLPVLTVVTIHSDKDLGSNVAKMCSNHDPVSCVLPSSLEKTWQRERQGQTHKEFFAHATAWRTPRNIIQPCYERMMQQDFYLLNKRSRQTECNDSQLHPYFIYPLSVGYTVCYILPILAQYFPSHVQSLDTSFILLGSNSRS